MAANIMDPNSDKYTWPRTRGLMNDTPLAMGTGFVDIFIGQIHSESDDRKSINYTSNWR